MIATTDISDTKALARTQHDMHRGRLTPARLHGLLTWANWHISLQVGPAAPPEAVRWGQTGNVRTAHARESNAAAHVPRACAQEVQHAIATVDLDGDAQIDLIEFSTVLRELRTIASKRLEASNKLGRSGEQELREAAKAAALAGQEWRPDNFLRNLLHNGTVGQTAHESSEEGTAVATLLPQLLLASRVPRRQMPRSLFAERARRLYQVRHPAPRRVGPPRRPGEPDQPLAHPPPDAGPVDADFEMSPLGAQLSTSAPREYTAAILLQAFFQPLAPTGVATGPAPSVALSLVQAHYLWAHAVGRGSQAREPPLTAEGWQACLQRYLRNVAGSRLVALGGTTVLFGMQLVHPAVSAATMHPWDMAQCLAFFGVSRPEDVPRPRAKVLSSMPVQLLWNQHAATATP